jgi:hypothetical protein
MHGLTCLHDGGHIYKPGGIGELDHDPAQHLIGSEEIVSTRDLPGFAFGGVTYESHHFWIHLCQYAPNPRMQERHAERFSSVLIRVNHGGGWEVWRGDYMLAAALARYGDDDMGAFWLCWYLIDIARTARKIGAEATAAEYKQAFVDGRLRKRKLPAQGKIKVWIEPPAASPRERAGGLNP